MTLRNDIRAAALTPGPMTALPGGWAEPIGDGVASVFAQVQGLLMHQFWAAAYGETLDGTRAGQSHLRSTAEMLAAVKAIDSAPLDIARPPARRLIGVCRHFTVLAVALLRRQGIPARSRCGFGYYFDGKPVDHWVVEYWDEDAVAWKLGDPQLDATQLAAIKADFDPLDVPRGYFLVAGAAWRRCRAERDDAMNYGILDMHGLWFIAGNLVRDIAALAGCELLPWDVWGGMFEEAETPDAALLAALDEAAEISVDPDARFDRLRELAGRDPRFQVPPQVTNALTHRLELIPAA
jgi:hypothetical protein